jgi:anti-sigma regulatory factor (Ser/Thr protein kinase)
MSESSESLARPEFIPAPLSQASAETGHMAGTALPGPARSLGGPSLGSVPPFGRTGNAATREWPLRSFMDLGALPSAVPCARLHARLLLQEWRLAGMSQDVELLVSELVTNRLQASRSVRHISPIRMWLLSDTSRVLILVWDASPQRPVLMDTGADAESGRGLLLVDAISHEWGWYATQETGGGKVVWALSFLPSARPARSR